MSNPGNGGEDEEEEEAAEEFYESLDRILSSSCSSTSASDDDADHHHHHHHRGRRAAAASSLFPRFPPPSAASYDVWISDPAPVEERRRRLLQQMGLASDPSLSRLRPDAAPSRPREAEIGRSVSHEGLCRRRTSPAAAPMARSRSDGSVDPDSVHKPHHRLQSSLGLPPLVGRPRASSVENHYESENGDDEHDGEDDRLRCTIRNLDNGEEFIVKEVREDGMWGQLREVGTGRQLTMEEFEMCVGRSPIVQELMRRQTARQFSAHTSPCSSLDSGPRASGAERTRKRVGWLRSIRSAVVAGAHHRDRRSSDERDTSSEKGGRRSSSATDDSQDGPHRNSLHHGPERVKVRHYGKSHKELTALYLSQEIQAHSGSIWCIKFSPNGNFLASAGEDCVIHVWQVSQHERREEFLLESEVAENGNCNPFFTVIGYGSPEPVVALSCVEANHWEKKRRAKVPGSRKSVSSDHFMVPEHVFALMEKPVCSFKGHLADVLDLSWSKSQYLLSSSMDKTVRLWHMSSNSCLKTFAHSDYVTCIQFNPVDDRYFISGSLDEKVRIWSIPDRQVVDWNDLNEMVTAACYTPDGQGALVGSHKGSCHLYDTSDNKLQQKSQIDLQNKKRRSNHKKITGFQFAPGSSSEVLVTSADSRIRVIDGVDLVHKFKGFRNTSSQISAYLTSNGKYVICASEDSHVYMWRYDADSRPNRSKGSVTIAQAYEHFHSRDVTVAIPWPSMGMGGMLRTHSNEQNESDNISQFNQVVQAEANGHDSSPLPAYRCNGFSQNGSGLNGNTSHFGDRVSATWPEEKLFTSSNKHSPRENSELYNGGMPAQSRSAWGLVIVTAGRSGEIKAFQNFGFPVRI